MLWDFVVRYKDTPTTSVTLTNVQQVSVDGGRAALTDNFSATRFTVLCRYPDGYNSPYSNLKPGAEISSTAYLVGDPTKLFGVFHGRVTDVSVQYGIPYANNKGPADLLTITAEGGLAAFGRAAGNGYAMPPNELYLQSQNLYESSGFALYFQPIGQAVSLRTSGATVDGSWADWLNQVAITIGGRLKDSRDVVYLYGSQPSYVSTITLSDQTSSSTRVPYDDIVFDSLSQNYFTQVTVDPVSYAEQVISNVPAGESPRNYTVNTYSASDGQATDLGNYYLSQFGTPQLGISEISVNLNDPRTLPLATMLAQAGNNLPIGVQLNVEFRGQTFPCFVEGAAYSASVGSQRLTMYLSSAALSNFLVLDNTVLGRLDYNRLGL